MPLRQHRNLQDRAGQLGALSGLKRCWILIVAFQSLPEQGARAAKKWRFFSFMANPALRPDSEGPDIER